MMHHTVLIILSAIFGIYQLFIVKDKLVKLILLILILGIVLTFLPAYAAKVAGFSIYILAGLGCIAYAIFARNSSGIKKSLVSIIILPVIIANIFYLCRLPFTGSLGFFMLAPILISLFVVTTDRKNYMNEIGFLVIFATDATIKFLMSIEWASQ